MPKTLLQLKRAVLAYMGRKQGDLTIDTVDYVTVAINNAKDFAQRAVDFEYARRDARVQNVSITEGASLTTAQMLEAPNSTIVVKSVESVWLKNQAATAEFPIAMISRDTFKSRVHRRFKDITRISEADDTGVVSNELTYVQLGQKFYIYPGDAEALGGSTFTVYLDVIQWIEDFANDGDTHWLFDYCFDFMLFRSIVELNFQLKEDERKVISDSHMDRIWNNVVHWNASVISSNTDDASLD